MARVASRTFNLGLRAKPLDELRAIASRFLHKEPQEIENTDRSVLIAELSRAAGDDPGLARELRKAQVAVKPSFYLMILAPHESKRRSTRSARELIKSVFDEINAQLRTESDVPVYKGFALEDIAERENDVVDCRFTWSRVYWYWSPSDVWLKNIYELRFGFAILDFVARKALISCHTQKERDTIAQALCKIYPITLSPMVLTKPLLDQIGSFDKVKRAEYFIAKPDFNIPANIGYADEKLGAKPIARAEEDNPRSQRTHSFYRIPLGSIVEQGVGVTSASGKLWIPREVPLDTVREFGIALLQKVSRRLDGMSRRGDLDNILPVLGLQQFRPIAELPAVLRAEVYQLVEHLVNMLVKGEGERPVTLSLELVTEGVPSLFEYPRLVLTDPESGSVSYWRNSTGNSEMVKIVEKRGKVSVVGHPIEEEVNLSALTHPISGAELEIADPLAHLDLVPTPRLHEILLTTVRHIAHQMERLRSVVCLPLRIVSNVLRLDVEQAFGRTSAAVLGTVVEPTNVVEFRKPLRKTLQGRDEEKLAKTLRSLGEECVHMSDDNCRSCIQSRRYLCLRSLVARYLREPLLLAHKGIELSDIQGKATVAEDDVTLFGFAKLAKGRSGLTARSENGAKLLAQVLGQADKVTFDTALVISPAAVNEDLRERLRFLLGIVGKRLIILDQPALAKMLVDFEEQCRFDGIDPRKIYRASWEKKARARRKKKGQRPR